MLPSKQLLKGPFLAIDFETASEKPNSACSIGLVLVDGHKVVEEEHYLIRPPHKTFRWWNTGIHGITWNDVWDAGDFADVWSATKHLFKDAGYLVAHNASFDCSVLDACKQHYGIKLYPRPFACTLSLARQHWQFRPANLKAVCKKLGIPLVKHHDALEDARASAQILIKSIKAGAEPTLW